MSLSEKHFPLDGIPQPWADIFDELTNKAFWHYIREGRLDRKRDLRLVLGCHILHWAVKLSFNPDHQLHPTLAPSPQYRETYRPWGNVIAKTIQLCRMAWNPESGYSNAAHWFLHIEYEGVTVDFVVPAHIKDRKQKASKLMRSQNQQLREVDTVNKKGFRTVSEKRRSNPFDRNQHPHTHKLFAVMIRLAAKSEEASTALDEFIEARSRLVTAMQRPEHKTYFEDEEGNPFLHLGGRGRGTIPLKTSPKAQELSNSPLVLAWADRELKEYNKPPTGLEIASHLQQQLGDPLILAILGVIGNQAYWEGTPSQLLEVMNGQVSKWPNPPGESDKWPKTSSHLSRALNQKIVQLEKMGVLVTQTHLSNRSKTRVTCIGKFRCACPLPSPELSA